MSDETYEKLAAGASKLLNRNISPSRLRPGAAADIDLPIRSYVGAGDEVVEPVEGDGPIDYVAAPPELAEGEVLEVRGRSMLPAYEHGDLLFHRFMDPDPRNLLGKLVIIKLKDGRRFVKVLQAGSKRGRFTLASLNPSYAPMEDQAVAAVARIVWVKKKG
ncbi:MAG: S24 family peptidase [Verrucomicrobiota bacterium]